MADEAQHELTRIFPGDSEMARRMREFDWSQTDAGPPEAWPLALRTAIGICLTSRFPMHVWWGRELTLFYNDAYISFLGPGKHPAMLGRSGREAWSEIWFTIGPMIERVFRTGEASWSEDILMYFNRRLPREEVYVTFSFSPVFAGSGEVGGLFCACTETTEKIIGNRWLDTLRRLGVEATVTRSVDEACRAAGEALAENPQDLPFSALYLVDEAEKDARLAAATGFAANGWQPPASVLLEHGDNPRHSPWPLAAVYNSRHPADCVARGRQAVVLPIRAPSHEHPVGLLVAGVSLQRPLDAAYRTFFDLVASHIATAITDACAYEQERKRAEALAEIDRAKTVFFSNVSHEFRTPLTLMLGPLEEIVNQPEGAILPPNRELAAVARRNGLRLLRLVNALLDFSRIEAGRMQAQYEPVDLAAYTTELASGFRSTVENAGLQYRVVCPPLPERVFVDREMWEKIVFNLLSNAFKFTFQGGITLALHPHPGRVELEVSDTGVGIPEAEIPHLFERFHRVQGSRSRTHEGTGIGLSLVHELVKMHAGQIQVHSSEGSGTTFRVFVPLGSGHLPEDRIADAGAQREVHAEPFVEEALRWDHRDADTAAALTRIPPAPAAGLTPLEVEASGAGAETSPAVRPRPRPRVLVADDNSDMRDYLTRLLGSRYEIEAVADGEAALERIDVRVPDLVVTDVMMPRRNGVSLLRRLRSHPRTRLVPVILLSARAGEDSRAEGLELGADDYLIKPFTARELLARVHTHLELARVRREAEHQVRAARDEAERFARKQSADLIQRVQTLRESEERLRFANADLTRRVEELERANSGSRGSRQAALNVLQDAVEARRRMQQEMVERRQIEDALALSQERLRLIVESALEHAIFSMDLDRRVTSWNAGAERLLGYTREEMIGQSGDLIFIPEDLATHESEKEAAEAVAHGRAADERWHRRKDGARFWGSGVALPMRARPNGEVIGLVKILRDETEKRQAREALERGREELLQALRETEQARADAEAATQAKDHFLAVLSHELRTPLTPVLMAAHVLARRRDLPETAKEALRMIRRNIQLEAHLVDDLLDVTRITRGKMELVRAPMDMHAVIEHAVEVTRGDFSAKRQRLVVDLEAAEHELNGDATRLKQVVWNLLKNASKFTPEGGEIRLRTRNEPGRLIVEVSDQGVGIEQEALGRIFDAFAQANPEITREFGGLGLGLAISRATVEAHGGTLQAASAGKGKGATFTASLPLAG